MKIALAQLNYHIGNFSYNVDKIVASIREAKSDNVDLVIFAELSVCGYPPRDFLNFESFIGLCNEGIQRIATECKDIAAIVGCPSLNKESKGKPLFNSAFFIANGKVEQISHKTLLPTYDIFDEYRYFEPNSVFNVVSYKGKKIAVTICEDIWNVHSNGLYQTNPLDALKSKNPDFIVNIAASPFSYDHAADRLDILKQNAKQYNCPIFYVNHIGAQTELIFDGGSMVLNENGETCGALELFKEDFQVFDVDQLQHEKGIKGMVKMESVHNALVLGINNYFNKLNFEKAVIALSGGIDSALTLALVVEALGNKNVLAVLMPSEFSSDHSVSDAKALCENLNCAYEIVHINDAYSTYNKLLQPIFQGKEFDVTEENIQARIRATIVMAISNKLGHILINTSNKSEMAVGYGTLYGDMCGGISVLGDLYKTEVYELSIFLNRNGEIIPKNTIEKPASAELRPDQKDSDSLPEYEILDQILYHYIEESLSPEDIIKKGYKADLVKKILKMVNTTEYKRFQAPPVLRVSKKAFGMGRRMPIVGKYLN